MLLTEWRSALGGLSARLNAWETFGTASVQVLAAFSACIWCHHLYVLWQSGSIYASIWQGHLFASTVALVFFFFTLLLFLLYGKRQTSILISYLLKITSHLRQLKMSVFLPFYCCYIPGWKSNRALNMIKLHFHRTATFFSAGVHCVCIYVHVCVYLCRHVGWGCNISHTSHITHLLSLRVNMKWRLGVWMACVSVEKSCVCHKTHTHIHTVSRQADRSCRVNTIPVRCGISHLAS